MERTRLYFDSRPRAVFAGDDDQRIIEGVAMSFAEVAEIHPGYTVQLDPGALTDAYDDVVLNAYEHDSAPFARTGDGGDLSLRLTKKEFRYSATVDADDQGFVDLWRRVKRGVVDGASLGIRIVKSEYEVAENGDVHQLVLDVERVFEVTLTNMPVFKSTTARGLRQDREYEQGRFAGVPAEVMEARERRLAASATKGSGKRPDLAARRRARRARVSAF